MLKKLGINSEYRWKIIAFYVYLRSRIYLSFFSHFFPILKLPQQFVPRLLFDLHDDVIIFTRLHILHGCNMYVRARAHRHVVKGRVDFQAETLQHPREQIPLFFVRVKQTENCGTVYSGWERGAEKGWNTSNIRPGPSTTASADS